MRIVREKFSFFFFLLNSVDGFLNLLTRDECVLEDYYFNFRIGSVRRVIRASEQFVLRGETGNEGSYYEISLDKRAVSLIFN